MSTVTIKELAVLIGLSFFGLINLYLKLYKHKISKADTFEESLKFRKNAFRLLKMVSVIIKIFQSFLTYSIILAIILSILFALLESQSAIICFVAIIVTFVIYVRIMFSRIKRWKNSNSIVFDFGVAGSRKFVFSFFTKTQYLESQPKYFLYLRGFGTDLYDTGSTFINPLKMFSRRRFEENAFVEYLAQYTSDIVAVGSPKEANCPKGATRIYLDNNTWKTDVRELMEKSEEIYILLHDSPACIWEIVNSVSMLQKTTFIVDDKITYKDIVNKSNLDVLPKEINLKKNEIAFISFRWGDVNIEILKRNKKSYAKYLKSIYQYSVNSNVIV